MTVIDILVGIFMTVGTLFLFVSAVGIYRMPDVYNQAHAMTIAGTVGLFSLLIAAMMALGTFSVVLHSFLVVIFHLMTAPVATHMIARIKHPDAWEGTWVDELAGEPTMCKPDGSGEANPSGTATSESPTTSELT